MQSLKNLDGEWYTWDTKLIFEYCEVSLFLEPL